MLFRQEYAPANVTTIISGTSRFPVAPLSGAEWRIEGIDEKGIVDDSHPGLRFLPEGQLVGNASCNRILGSDENNGGHLRLTAVATTRAACPEALTAQESRVLDILSRVDSYRIDETGALVMTTAGSAALIARR